ncbi:MAG: VTT domain-containing protein [Trueperaceae bacterium]
MIRRTPRAVLRWIAGAAWAALLGGYLWTVAASGRTPIDVLGEIVAFLVDHPLGPVLYVMVCAVRPLFVFSSSVLTIGAGHLYGPTLGLLVVTVGQNAGAVLAYALAATFGAELAGRALAHPRLRGAASRLRRNAFATVLTLRLVFTPYDAVNYTAGALRLPLRAFVTATLLGSLPGALTFLLFGASIGDLSVLADGRWPSIDPWTLAASAALLAVTLTVSRTIRRRSSLPGATP